MAIGVRRSQSGLTSYNRQQNGPSMLPGPRASRSTVPTESLPSPEVLGLPPKFKSWRPDQWQAVQSGADGTDGPDDGAGPRVVFQCAPTGFGKSPVYVANALLEVAAGGRVVICTSTKGLQDQLAADFEAEGVTVDIKGKNAYRCLKLGYGSDGEPNGCDVGPCHTGYECELKQHGCLYYDQYAKACQAPVVVTNYSYWMSINAFGQGLTQEPAPAPTMLILDEGHDAPEWLAGFLSVELTESDVNIVRSVPECEAFRMDTWSVAEWRQVGLWYGERVSAEIVKARKGAGRAGTGSGEGRRFRDLKRVSQKLDMMATMEDGHWHVEMKEVQHGFGRKRTTRRVVKFDAINPARYAAKYLFRGVRKVLIFSATVRPKTADLLGLNDYRFHEYPSTFPVSRHPIIHVPTIRLSHRSTDGELALWLSRIDGIIRERTDRSGIIHTVSYKRARMILEQSQYSHMMITHDSDNARETIERFKRSDRPVILVSPSVTTGYDFPYGQCEYQIIGKIPFPDTKEGVAKVRATLDRDWPNYVAAQTLVQMTGRGMRAADDQCEDFVIDDNITWFVRKYGGYIPDWWHDLYRSERVIPSPPVRLGRRLLNEQPA